MLVFVLVFALMFVFVQGAQVVFHQAFGQLEGVLLDHLVDQIAVQFLPGHKLPALCYLVGNVLAQILQAVELFPEILGEFVVQFGHLAFPHFPGCDAEVLLFAGQLFIG